jgi:hypothetical protein
MASADCLLSRSDPTDDHSTDGLPNEPRGMNGHRWQDERDEVRAIPFTGVYVPLKNMKKW